MKAKNAIFIHLSQEPVIQGNERIPALTGRENVRGKKIMLVKLYNFMLTTLTQAMRSE